MRRRLLTAALTAAVAAVTVATVVPASAGTPAHYRVEKGFKLNDLRITPGAIFHVSTATVCRKGYAGSVRNVSTATKNKAYTEYGITTHRTGQYEIDHLISLELGGDNELKNLWPEPDDLGSNRNTKDNLENHLHALVCSGQVSLAAAQKAIATDWVKAYARYMPIKVGKAQPVTAPKPTPTPTPTATPTPAGAAVAITSIVDPVSPGGTEQATASSTAGDSCDLEVTLPSGRQSTASGLGPHTMAGDGTSSWTWEIGSTTGAGTATATLACGAGNTSRTFTIN